jgi:chaperonin GroEL
VLTTEAIVVDKPEPKNNKPAGGGGGADDYDY